MHPLLWSSPCIHAWSLQNFYPVNTYHYHQILWPKANNILIYTIKPSLFYVPWVSHTPVRVFVYIHARARVCVYTRSYETRPRYRTYQMGHGTCYFKWICLGWAVIQLLISTCVECRRRSRAKLPMFSKIQLQAYMHMITGSKTKPFGDLYISSFVMKLIC